MRETYHEVICQSLPSRLHQLRVVALHRLYVVYVSYVVYVVYFVCAVCGVCALHLLYVVYFVCELCAVCAVCGVHVCAVCTVLLQYGSCNIVSPNFSSSDAFSFALAPLLLQPALLLVPGYVENISSYPLCTPLVPVALAYDLPLSRNITPVYS